VEAAAARNADSELNGPLLHTPEHIQAEVGKYSGRQKASVSVVQTYQKFIQKGDQRPVEAFGDVSENSN